MCGTRAAIMAHDVRRVLVTRVKRETLGKNRGGAEVPKDQSTLHDASLRGYMHAAVQKVNVAWLLVPMSVARRPSFRIISASSSRNIAGEVRPYFYQGRKWGENVRYDNSLALAVLKLMRRDRPPGPGWEPVERDPWDC